MTKTPPTALDQLRDLEARARDADAETGLLRQAEQDAIREARLARAAVESYWREIGGGAEPDEARLKRLTAEANRLGSSLAKRVERGTEVERSIEFEAKIRASELRHFGVLGEVRDYARAHRAEIESAAVDEALHAHDEALAAAEALRQAARRHEAAGRAFADLAHTCSERTSSSFLPVSPFLRSDWLKHLPVELEPPIPRHCLDESVVEHVAQRQPAVAETLGRKLAERQARDADVAERQERQRKRDADRAAA
jgi:hypothetical protein